MLRQPYLLFLGDAPDLLAAKVAKGIRDWRPDAAVGQLRLPGCEPDMGLPDMTIAEAAAAGAQTLVVGVANRGGVISRQWIAVLKEALAAGMDVAAGLHNHLQDEPELVAAAEAAGRRLFDVRIPQHQYPIAEGRKRQGRRCLTVGTDCSIGKMYTSMALEHALRERGTNATFRATGQTGILITGVGVPLDAVIADFMAGAVEWLTPDNAPDHWDIIEGQGSLFHPSYSGVTLALIHGGQPDALILCHEPERAHMRGLPHYRVPGLSELRELTEPLARLVNPAARAVGVALNTSAFDDDAARAWVERAREETGLPATDPVRYGAGPLVAALEAY